jgi:hypothetical protein
MEQMEAQFFNRADLEALRVQTRQLPPEYPELKARFANKILRGELSAIEAYNQVIESFFSEPGAPIATLRQLRDEHQSSCESLRRLVENIGEEPAEESGTWGATVAALVNVRSLFGKDQALRTLKTGEEHGLKQYHEMLDDFELNDRERIIIRDVLLPRQLRHIAQLDSLISESELNS